MILLIDNYDSFSYNLYQLVGALDPDIRVVRNDQLSVADIRTLAPRRLILSPGPGRPADAGVCEDAVRELAGELPIQEKLDRSGPLFRDLPETITAARYHSLAAAEDTLPACLRVTARSDDGEVMAVAHRDYPVYGLQFHPESILTPMGNQILKHFLEG